MSSSNPLLESSENLFIERDRESLVLEMVYAALNLAEKILTVLYCIEHVPILAIYGVHIGSAVLKSASTQVKNPHLKLAAKIIVELGQLGIYLALLGYDFRVKDPVAYTFIAICAVQVALAVIMVPREAARRAHKKQFVREHPGMFPLYERWDGLDLAYVRTQIGIVRIGLMSMPVAIPFFMPIMFTKHSPFFSDTFFLLTGIFLWSLEELNKKGFAEQTFIFNKAGSSYISEMVIEFCKDHFHGPGPFENEVIPFKSSMKMMIDSFNFRVLFLCCVAWYAVYIFYVLRYCPTLPKSDQDYIMCMIIVIPSYVLVGMVGLCILIALLVVCLVKCSGMNFRELVEEAGNRPRNAVRYESFHGSDDSV